MRLLRTKRHAVFYADRLALLLGEDSDRLAAMRNGSDRIDLVTWNVFASLATHRDQGWLAYRLQALGGASLRSPVRISLWTGRQRGPVLRPSPTYVHAVKQRSAAVGGTTDLATFAQPIEVPVRIESPDTLVLVDAVGEEFPRGSGGRDRVVELIDAGLGQARRLTRSLTVAVVYPSGTHAAAELSARINDLRGPAALAAELAYQPTAVPLALRELSWQRLLHLWDAERGHLDLAGQPVKAFLAELERRGLR